jgi:hypothetical protein
MKRRVEEGAEIRQPRVEVEDKVPLIGSSTDCWPPPTAEVVAVKLLPVEEARKGSADGVEAVMPMKNMPRQIRCASTTAATSAPRGRRE